MISKATFLRIITGLAICGFWTASSWGETPPDSFGLGVRIKNVDFNLPTSDLSNARTVPEVYFRAPKGRLAFEMSFSKFSTSYQESGQSEGLVLQFTPTKGAVLVQEPVNYQLKETLTITPIVGSVQFDVLKQRNFRTYVGGGFGFYHLRYEKSVVQTDIPASYGGAGTEVIPAEHGEVGMAWTFFDRVSIVANARRSFAHSSRGWTLLKDWNQSEPTTAPIEDLSNLSYGLGLTVRL